MKRELFYFRELLGQNVENIRRLLLQTITNEMSATRSPNNMMLITVMFQQSPEQTSKVCLFKNIYVLWLCRRENLLALGWSSRNKKEGAQIQNSLIKALFELVEIIFWLSLFDD